MNTIVSIGFIASMLNKLKQHPAVLAAIIIVIGCFIWLSFLLHHHILSDTKHELAIATANTFAQQQLITANTYFDQRQQQLRALSEKNLFIDALASGNTKEIEQMEKLMTEWIDGLTIGYLLNPTDTRLDRAHNFAGQQQALISMQGSEPKPVAAYINDAWQFIYAFPLIREGELFGSMLTMLSTETLTELLSNVNSEVGTTQLYQKLPKVLDKAVINIGNPSEALETISLKTRIPHLEIHFTGSSLLLKQSDPSYKEYYLFLSVLFASMLIVIYLIIRLTLYKGTSGKILLNKDSTSGVDNNTHEDNHHAKESYLQVLPSAADTQPSDTKPDNDDTENQSPITLNSKLSYPSVIFRDYDIRGLAYTELTPVFASQLGKLLATKALALGERSLVVGCDGRHSSAELTAALEQGIMSTGCDVIYLGQVPTPLLNFATHHLIDTDCGIMVTASHNPKEYNGFKIFFKHRALCGDDIQSLRVELEQDFPEASSGSREVRDLSPQYIESIVSDIVPAENLKVVVDAGNGVAGIQGCDVLEAIGCDVIPLYCEVDGDFPNRSPDTSTVKDLADLVACVKESSADLGIAFDGDGDRMVAVSASGTIIWPDELLMIFARDVVSRHPGADIVFDVKSTSRLTTLVSSYGGRPVMWKTGHSHMHNKISECDAPVGGEFSGHIFFRDRWYGFDDGIYAAARLVEIIAIREQGLDEMMESFEQRFSTAEIKIEVAEQDKFTLMENIVSNHNFEEGKISTIDGLRLDLPEAWGLIRASNTSASLTLRFEATTEQALVDIQSEFRQQLQRIDKTLTF